MEVELGEITDLSFGIDTEIEQPNLRFVKQVRIGLLRQQCCLVIGFEGVAGGVGSLVKSNTAVPRFSGWVRLSRDKVCTAFTPPSFLSTYIVCSKGWSKPVWNLLATPGSDTRAARTPAPSDVR